jgi:hypothetical protein
VSYLLLTMPKVDDDRYKVLKDSAKVLYEECKAAMEQSTASADVTITPLLVDESEDEVEKFKKMRDKLETDWNEHRENIYQEKLQEIEDAHNLWMADRVEETLDGIEERDAHNESQAAYTMKLNPDDF